MGRQGNGGSQSGRGRGNSRSSNNSSSSRPKKETPSEEKGKVAALGTNVFDYGNKKCADLLRTTLEAIVTYVGTQYGNDIKMEIVNRKTFVVPKPQYEDAVEKLHQSRLSTFDNDKKAMLRAYDEKIKSLTDDKETVLAAKTKIERDEYARLTKEMLEVKMTPQQKTHWDNQQKSWQQRDERLQQHRGKVFSLIEGQCTQSLREKLKQSKDYGTVMQGSDPLALLTLIEKTVLSQNEERYCCDVWYDVMISTLTQQQNEMSNDTYHEKFNTKMRTALKMEVNFDHEIIWKYEAKQVYGSEFDSLDPMKQAECKETARERLFAYIMLRQSNKTNSKLKTDLHDDFGKGQDNYPKTRSETLRLLDVHTKTSIDTRVAPASEATTFAQRRGTNHNKSGKSRKEDAENEAKPKTCWFCKEEGHVQNDCPKLKALQKLAEKADDSSSRSSSRSRSSASSSRSSSSRKDTAKKLEKHMKKQFANYSKELAALKEESSISSNESAGSGLSFCTIGATLKQAVASGVLKDLDLRKVILFDTQSTDDVFCNKKYLRNIRKSNQRMPLHGNGGILQLEQIGELKGYHHEVWYNKNAIANILSKKWVSMQYRVSMDTGTDGSIWVHRSETSGLPDIEFKMHVSGLHYWDPTKSMAKTGPDNKTKKLTFVETVEDRKKMYSKRQVKLAEVARAGLHNAGFPSEQDFRLMV
jgi:Zinc knuckle